MYTPMSDAYMVSVTSGHGDIDFRSFDTDLTAEILNKVYEMSSEEKKTIDAMAKEMQSYSTEISKFLSNVDVWNDDDLWSDWFYEHPSRDFWECDTDHQGACIQNMMCVMKICIDLVLYCQKQNAKLSPDEKTIQSLYSENKQFGTLFKKARNAGLASRWAYLQHSVFEKHQIEKQLTHAVNNFKIEDPEIEHIWEYFEYVWKKIQIMFLQVCQKMEAYEGNWSLCVTNIYTTCGDAAISTYYHPRDTGFKASFQKIQKEYHDLNKLK